MTNGHAYRWTLKLPLMIAAAVTFLVGVVGWRKSVYIGLPIVIVAVLIYAYAVSIKEWCVPNENRFGQLAWGQHKFHFPSFYDCVPLVRGDK